MAELTKPEKLSPNTSSELNSANSSFSIIDPIEVNKDIKDLDDEKVAIPFTFLKGEHDLFSGNSADGVAVLTNYRFFHHRYETDRHINVPLGLISHVQTSGRVLFIFCKNGRSYSLGFCSKIEIWKAQIESKLNHLEAEACFAFSHFIESSKEKDQGVSIIESSSNGKILSSTETENLAAVDGKDATFKNGHTINSANGTELQKSKNCESNGDNATSEKLDGKSILSIQLDEISIGLKWILQSPDDFKNSLVTKEAQRMNFNLKDVWRISTMNECYEFFPSYPRQIIVPINVSDLDLIAVSKYRRKQRVPAVVWRHKGNGRVIARSSQPSQGLLGYTSLEDQKLLAAIHKTCCKDTGKESSSTLLIVDARSGIAAYCNRLKVGGHEDIQYYNNCEIEFMGIDNIHRVRESLDAVAQLCATPDKMEWLKCLDDTKWMFHISNIIQAATVIVHAIHDNWRPVLVHCSDGWDRTSQLTSLAQLMLDPYYRTIEGFEVLVEREWLQFGHKFADRCGHWNSKESEYERSPVFLQWLDCVFQLQQQFPFHFEFNEQYLIRLATHTYSCLFGTFLCNTDKQRQFLKLHEKTLSLWPLLREVKEFYNGFYCESEEVLRPSCQIRNLTFWKNMYVESGFIQQTIFKMLPPKEEFESQNNSNASDDPPKRKTSSPIDDIDQTKSQNPLDTSDIPEIPDLEVSEPKDSEAPDEKDAGQFSGPLDMLSYILPNVYNMYDSLSQYMPSLPFYGDKPQKKTPSVIWVFYSTMEDLEKPAARVLDFDGLFVQKDLVSVMAEKFCEKNLAVRSSTN